MTDFHSMTDQELNEWIHGQKLRATFQPNNGNYDDITHWYDHEHPKED